MTIRNAATASQADVATQVALCVAGDTVVIPATSGTNWSTKVTVPLGITLQGQGITSGSNLTKINYNGVIPLVEIGGFPSDQPVRITGIYFDLVASNSTVRYAIRTTGKDHNGSGQEITQLRIDHCKFNLGKRQIDLEGWVYGVIDHNEFVDADIAVGFASDNEKSWDRAIAPGGWDSMFLEDNLFTITNTRPVGNNNEQVYHQDGARSVIRYNHFDGTAMSADDSLIIDSHGNLGYGQNTGTRGQPLIEIYENDVNIHHTYRIFYIRGGSLLIWNNRFTTVTGTPDVVQVTEEESWQSAFFSPLRGTWPAQDQINNTFLWGNTLKVGAGSTNPVTNVDLNNGADSTFIQQNRDYWMHAPESAASATPGRENYTGARKGGSTTDPTDGSPLALDTGSMSFTGTGDNAYYLYSPAPYPHYLIQDVQAGVPSLRSVIRPRMMQCT